MTAPREEVIAKLATRAAVKIGALEKLLSVSELEAIIGIERSTIFRWYKAGKFPAPSHLMGKRVWPVSEIETWVAENLVRPAQSNPNVAPAGASAAA
jgi:predicted DNA-binding transcriptional regulator AlpA